MLRRAIIPVLIACGSFLSAASLAQETPHAVSVYPDLADVDVDPALPEIWIEFDRDMRTQGHSLCTAGGVMPKISGKARWIDVRTFAIPVALEPATTYAFRINCPSAQNFRGADGTAAESKYITFTTLGADELPKTLTPEMNAEAMLRLRRAVSERYAHAHLCARDPSAVLNDAEPALLACNQRGQFARTLAGSLGAFKDIHVSVVVGDIRLGAYSSSFTSNFDGALLERSVPDLRKLSANASVGTIEGGIAYLFIRTWSPANGREDIVPIVEHILALNDVRGLIIDVRANGGGDESLAELVASCVTEHPVSYSSHRFRDPDAPGGWSTLRGRDVGPREDGRCFKGPVAVLIGPGCCSSNESFVAMIMAGDPHRAFGSTTRGSSGNPRRHDLGNGVFVVLPSWEDYLVNGTPLEGHGINPDVSVPWPEHPDRDVVLDAAANWLRDAR